MHSALIIGNQGSHNVFQMLAHLLMFLGSLYCKQYGPREQSDQGS